MLNAPDITKFIAHDYNVIIDVMDKITRTTRNFVENISRNSLAF